MHLNLIGFINEVYFKAGQFTRETVTSSYLCRSNLTHSVNVSTETQTTWSQPLIKSGDRGGYVFELFYLQAKFGCWNHVLSVIQFDCLSFLSDSR